MATNLSRTHGVAAHYLVGGQSLIQNNPNPNSLPSPNQTQPIPTGGHLLSQPNQPFKYQTTLAIQEPRTMGVNKSCKLMRASINACLHNYPSLASTSILLLFPVSASILLSQAAATPSSPLLRTIASHLRSLFDASGLPASSQFFSFLNLRLSQTILTTFTTLPLTLTLLVLAKISVVRTIVSGDNGHLPPLMNLYHSLLPTHLFNSFVILAANAAVFSIFILAFSIADILGFASTNAVLVISAAGAVLYSIVLANTVAVCSLAAVVSVAEGGAGCLPFLRACVLIKGREATAVTLALPVNLGLAATEALFQYRVARPYHETGSPSAVWEAFWIVCMYSLLVALDVVISCMLFKSCRSSSWEINGYELGLQRPQDKGGMQV